MFKNRTVQMKMIKDSEAGVFSNNTDFATNLSATEASVNRVIDNVVKGAVTIIAVQTAAKILLRLTK